MSKNLVQHWGRLIPDSGKDTACITSLVYSEQRTLCPTHWPTQGRDNPFSCFRIATPVAICSYSNKKWTQGCILDWVSVGNNSPGNADSKSPSNVPPSLWWDKTWHQRCYGFNMKCHPWKSICSLTGVLSWEAAEPLRSGSSMAKVGRQG